MNILLLNDDGPETFGFRLLRDAVARHWSRSTVVAIAPKTDQSGVGMGVQTSPEKMKPQKQSPGFFVVPNATPADIVHLAFSQSDSFLPGGRTFDLVISGVNHGPNVGMSIFTSGTVGAAMLAATHYGVCGWAFSQAFALPGVKGSKPKGDTNTRKAFANSIRYLPHFFENCKPVPGECLNVNFPHHTVTKGWTECHIAPFDPYIGPRFTPQIALQQQNDVSCLIDGYMTRSQVALSFNPPLGW